MLNIEIIKTTMLPGTYLSELFSSSPIEISIYITHPRRKTTWATATGVNSTNHMSWSIVQLVLMIGWIGG